MPQPPFSAPLFWFALALFSAPFFLMANPARQERGLLWALGALGLVMNAVVLWNTIYLDAALAQLRREGYPVHDAGVARLSPLIHEHINMLGRYSFSVPEAVSRGELRPLRNPAEQDT